jgi:hypothetical protein
MRLVEEKLLEEVTVHYLKFFLSEEESFAQ